MRCMSAVATIQDAIQRDSDGGADTVRARVENRFITLRQQDRDGAYQWVDSSWQPADRPPIPAHGDFIVIMVRFGS